MQRIERKEKKQFNSRELTIFFTFHFLVIHHWQVYLLKDDKKVSKKKTSFRRSDSSPIFNESMIFSVPPYMLNSIQIRLTVVNAATESSLIENNTFAGGVGNTVIPIGHVIVGIGTSGKGLRHWNQMMASLRKPVAMWHAIRQTNSEKTGIVNA